MGRTACIALILLGSAAAAAASPPPPPDEAPPAPEPRPRLEWSTWLRIGYGVAQTPDDAAQPRLVTPPEDAREGRWEAAVGADVTLGVGDGGDLRLGGWAEARTSSLPVAGLELVVAGAPDRLDMFLHEGEGVLAIRAGGNHEVVTGAIAYGYRAPWQLWGPWPGCTRYMIGVRLVASATRSIADPTDWSMTAGLEVEPVGALRYLLGIRSWY